MITRGGTSAMRLYWTPSPAVKDAKASGKYQLPSETIALPAEFWSDLKQILGLLIQTRLAELTFGQEGHYVADRLAPLIAQVRTLADSKEGVWNPETLAGVRFSLAIALETLGEQSGKNASLVESVGLFKKVLDIWTRDRVPLKSAATQKISALRFGALGSGRAGRSVLRRRLRPIARRWRN